MRGDESRGARRVNSVETGARLRNTEFSIGMHAIHHLHERARDVVRARTKRAAAKPPTAREVLEAVLAKTDLSAARAADLMQRLVSARLTCRLMRATQDLLLNEALKDAGIAAAGERLELIAAVRDDSAPT